MSRIIINIFCWIIVFSVQKSVGQIYVSPDGDDNNNGTMTQPKATLNGALRQAREIRRLSSIKDTKDVKILLQDGMYFLEEPVIIRPEDSGYDEYFTIIEALKGAKPIISGGIKIKAWKKLNNYPAKLPILSRAEVWAADVPLVGGQLFNFRQLWVNDKKATRAKSANGNTMHRILNWDKQKQAAVIPSLPFAHLQKETGLEMFIHQWWEIAILRIKALDVFRDSARLFFYQPEAKIQSEHPWPAPWLSEETGNSAFFLTNALQFLDEPGEWYLDVPDRKLYYWPRHGEDMSKAKVIAPFLETLLEIKGTKDTPVRNIKINGISFQHTGWMRPSLQGHVPHQAGMFMWDAYKIRPAGTQERPALDNQAWVGRPTAAVAIDYATNIRINDCDFSHYASSGLDMHKGVKASTVTGNLFKDIGGTALLAGVFSEPTHEVHIPYNPEDEREVTDNILIKNNFITDASNEDWGCVGIGAGYVRNIIISNNEIENVSYSGISIGWGWTPQTNIMSNNKVIKNKIHHYGKHNYDCAGIYTLSAQPGSVIAENYIDSIYKAPYVHLPTHWFYLYTDEGSSEITIKNNWTPTAKYLQNNNGPNNIWNNNGPEVDELVKKNAGIESEYKMLTKNSTVSNVSLPINKQRKELMELIVHDEKEFDLNKLKLLLNQNGMDRSSIYQWKNHYIIYSYVQDIGVIKGRIKNNFSKTEVRVYHDLFYEFDKQNHCNDKTLASEWDYVIMTANLVSDKNKQQEYLDYHATQFQKWPEVSQGFCNADFQKLLLFKNGRQLMLIIAIPKGESLEKLNPKTTKNNPRVNDWNKIMAPYQEGIEGTSPGEKWVLFQKSN